MKRFVLVSFIITALVLLFVSACTPPPPPEETTNGTETAGTTGQTETTGTEAVTPSAGGSAEEVVTESADGTTQTITEPGETKGPGEETTEEIPGETTEEEITSETLPADYFSKYATWPPESISQEDIEMLRHAVVVLETTKGTIKIRVFPDAAPIHSANFVKLALEGFYDGSPFHRVVRNFMSQGGGLPDGTDAGYTLPAEIGLPHKTGSVAAARQGDNVNPQRRSSGSQFYMCHSTEGCSGLDGQYTVFGEIVEGQDVNLMLSVNNDGRQAIPGAMTDRILRAYVEVGQ
jgi:cyclophilin family peptidyl-prolyl cis-trans isomerase